MIPPFTAGGVLPPGVHSARWEELTVRLGWTAHRRRLLRGLAAAMTALERAGCRAVYVDGSFVTAKPIPGDFDACWDPTGVDPDRLDPVLLTFANRRAAQKAKYGGELFPSQVDAAPGTPFLEFFQTDRETGDRKGILLVTLGDGTIDPATVDRDDDHERATVSHHQGAGQKVPGGAGPVE